MRPVAAKRQPHAVVGDMSTGRLGRHDPSS
jgi:hypothetical protein